MKHCPGDDDDTSRSLWQHSPPFRYLSYLTVLVALLLVMAILWQNNVVIWRPPPDIQAGSSPGPIWLSVPSAPRFSPWTASPKSHKAGATASTPAASSPIAVLMSGT